MANMHRMRQAIDYSPNSWAAPPRQLSEGGTPIRLQVHQNSIQNQQEVRNQSAHFVEIYLRFRSSMTASEVLSASCKLTLLTG